MSASRVLFWRGRRGGVCVVVRHVYGGLVELKGPGAVARSRIEGGVVVERLVKTPVGQNLIWLEGEVIHLGSGRKMEATKLRSAGQCWCLLDGGSGRIESSQGDEAAAFLQRVRSITPTSLVRGRVGRLRLNRWQKRKRREDERTTRPTGQAFGQRAVRFCESESGGGARRQASPAL